MKSILLITALLASPVTLATTAVEKECTTRAELVRVIKQEYNKGTSKELVMLAFNGSTELDRALRKMTHVIYRGNTDSIAADDMFNITYDICINNLDR